MGYIERFGCCNVAYIIRKDEEDEAYEGEETCCKITIRLMMIAHCTIAHLTSLCDVFPSNVPIQVYRYQQRPATWTPSVARPKATKIAVVEL